MIDFGKLYCDLHPHQIITNFCLKETCMVGLCATCICTHTEYHVNNKTTPQYQNIRATFSTMHEMIRKKISSLDSQKNRIEKITEFIQTKRRAVKQNIQQTRKQAIAAVNNFFDNREKGMLREMESEEKKMGLHSQARMESLMNSLNRESSLLITSAQQLNSQNFLESYQRIKTQTLLNATKLEQEITRELDRNEDFETIINSNDEFTQNIFKALEQSLQLSFKMNYRPFVARVQQPQVFSNDPVIICQEKVTSRFGAPIQECFSHPVCIPRPSSSMESGVYSAMSFSQVPEISKKQTAKFKASDQSQKQTSKSIPFDDTEKSTILPTGRQNKSLINELTQSNFVKDSPVYQSQIFRQRDSNERQMHQSLNKASINRNHQSQMILVQKPFGYQSANGWNVPQTRGVHHASMNQSLAQNLNQFSQQRLNKNVNSQINIRNQSSVNLHQFQKPVMNQKFNFVPQIYDPVQFNNKSIAENQLLSSDCKKVRKSGLTLLKVNQPNSTSRTKLQAE